MFKFLKPKPKTSAEEKLEKIADLLFPKLKLHIDEKGNKYHIDYSADSNLDAALSDLEDGHNDEASRKTIRNVSNRLYEIRLFLEAFRSMDSNAKYIIVEDLETKKLEEISVSDQKELDTRYELQYKDQVNETWRNKMNVYIQYQDTTGNWRLCHVTQNVQQLIISSMKAAQNIHPTSRIRAVSESGNVIDIL